MNKIDRNNVEKLLDGANTLLMSTDKGIMVEGNTPYIMTCLSALIRNLNNNNFPKELIEKSIEVGFMSDKELKANAIKSMENWLNKLKNNETR